MATVIEGTSLTLGPRDTRLIERAIEHGWDIPEELRRRLPLEMAKIVLKSEDERQKIRAASVIVAMNGQNQRAQPAVRKHEHTHTILTLEQRKQRLIEAVDFRRHDGAGDTGTGSVIARRADDAGTAGTVPLAGSNAGGSSGVLRDAVADGEGMADGTAADAGRGGEVAAQRDCAVAGSEDETGAAERTGREATGGGSAVEGDSGEAGGTEVPEGTGRTRGAVGGRVRARQDLHGDQDEA